MSRRTAITFAAVATILFVWGLQNIVGALPPDPLILLGPSIIPAIGFIVAIPLWIAALQASIRYRAGWWVTFLIVAVPVMPVAVLVYYVAISDEQLLSARTGSVDRM